MRKARAVLFLNGEYQGLEQLKLSIKPDDLLVAVDGGMQHLQKLQLFPKLLIGDLDSIKRDALEKLQKSEVEIIKFPTEKDETDLELALNEVVNRGFREIIIFGGFGGRLDHTLENLFLLSSPKLSHCDVRFVDLHLEAFIIKEEALIKGKIGDVVSLLPIHGIASAITTSGLKYPLKNESLFPEKSRGISNVMTSEKVKVTIKKGLLLCIHLQNH